MDPSKQKPNLLSPSKHAQDGDKRILSSLDHSVLNLPPNLPGRRYLNGWTLGLLALLLLGVAAWLTQRAGSDVAPAAKARPVSVTAARRATVIDAGTAPGFVHPANQVAALPALPAGLTPTPPPPSLPATIINEAPATGKAQHTAAHAPQDHPATVASLGQADPSHPTSLHEKITPEKTLHGNTALEKTANEKHRAAGTAARLPHASAAISPTGGYSIRGAAPASARPASEAAIAAAKPSADSDIALLTALVAHAGRPAAVATDHNRDIVERSETDKTETLLQRCRQLGMIEGMLCRSRICAGRWEDDVACRAPARAP
ncbi:hypothetical protein HSX11_28800 [Oxalobacteraceae bacterium]|nr:hypothetical protein [Oxalobacteraceae bacterium]